MLGRRKLPQAYRAWNLKWGAPFGRPSAHGLSLRQRLESKSAASFGPFAFQPSNLTRAFEYPWSFFAGHIRPGMRVLDVGGGLFGMQFVLALSGCSVTNVDPSAKTGSSGPFSGWGLSPKTHRRMNRIFGTDVRLVADSVENARLPAASFDRVYCLSVLEHLPFRDARRAIAAIERLLAPEGLLLLTVDLFLDVVPFGVMRRNVWGWNHDVYRLLRGSKLALASGARSELLGFPEFDFDRVVRLVPRLLIGHYPCVSQAMALRRPE